MMIDYANEARLARNDKHSTYRKARKLLHDADASDEAARQADSMAAWWQDRADRGVGIEDDPAAVAGHARARAAAWRRHAASSRALAPRYVEFARAHAKAERVYRSLATR